MALDDLPFLQGPFEFLELQPGVTRIFHVIRWDLGQAQTHPPWTPKGTLVWNEIIRIHLPRAEKPNFPFYYDFGQKTLVPQLKAVLPQAKLQGVGISLEAVGTGPKKRFSVGLETVQPG